MSGMTAASIARRVRSRIELVLNAAIAQGLRTATLINPAGGKLIAAAHPSKRKGERPHYRAVKIDDAQEVFRALKGMAVYGPNRSAAIGGARSALGRRRLRSPIVDAPAGEDDSANTPAICSSAFPPGVVVSTACA